MKKISCDIIKDVLPLYLDDVVSSDTKEMVEEHLKSCSSCREEANTLKKDIVLPANQNFQLAEARVLKNLKARFLKRKIVVSIVSVAVAILVMIALYSYAALSKAYVPYDNAIISVDEADGKLYATYRGENLGGTVSAAPQSVMVDGKEKNIVAFYYYETLWSKHIEPIFNGGRKANEKQIVFCLGSKDDIDQVYYDEFDLDGSDIDYTAITKESDMIWGE